MRSARNDFDFRFGAEGRTQNTCLLLLVGVLPVLNHQPHQGTWHSLSRFELQNRLYKGYERVATWIIRRIKIAKDAVEKH